MGDPKKIRKSFKSPNHPWQKARIDKEKALKKEFKFKNKTELWKTKSKLENFKNIVKSFATRQGPQVEIERVQIKDRLVSLGLLKQESTLSDTLSISDEEIMGRRLQSVVFKKKLARSIKHARQLIVHKHIAIGDKVITSPSMLVTLTEENQIVYAPGSNYVRADHPERYIEKDLGEVALKKEMEAASKDSKPPVEEDLVIVPEDEEATEVGKKVEAKKTAKVEEKEIEIPEAVAEAAVKETKEE